MRLAAAALLAALPLAAAVADPLEDAIEARQGFYRMIAIEMGRLSAMAKGEAPYDAAVAEKAGANLAALAGYDVTGLFLDGTARGEAPEETDALPAIWENPSDFAAKFAAFGAAVGEARPALAQGQEALGPALGGIGGTCKACHDAYRAD